MTYLLSFILGVSTPVWPPPPTFFSFLLHCECLGYHIVGRAILYLQNSERNSGSYLGGRDLMDYTTLLLKIH